MDIVTPKTTPGVMELLPREQIAFQRLLATIRRGYELFGFVPVETPVMELKDVLLTKSGGETEKQVYLVQSTGSHAQGDDPKLALRFDLTVPLARYVAEHENDLVFPFRRYQIQRVYRGESAQKGRFREFYQCDVDIIGKDTLPLACDAEIPVVIYRIFKDLGFGPFTISISNRKILRGLMAHLGIDAARGALVVREIDKLDKRGLDHVRQSLGGGDLGLRADQIDVILGLVTFEGSHAEVLARIEAVGSDDALLEEGARELGEVLEAIRDYGVPETAVRANLAIARGLDYYTGTVYETILDEHAGIGSVCSGGRYDDLAGFYTKSRLPGVGISIGATRLFYQLRAAGLIGPADASTTDVLVTQMDAALAEDYRRVASRLRDADVATELYCEAKKLKKQLAYADRAGIRFALIMGGDEKAKGTVTVKDLVRGEQAEVPVEAAAAHVNGALGRG